MRLFTRNGSHDWTERYPAIAAAAATLPARSFLIDGEAGQRFAGRRLIRIAAQLRAREEWLPRVGHDYAALTLHGTWLPGSGVNPTALPGTLRAIRMFGPIDRGRHARQHEAER